MLPAQSPSQPAARNHPRDTSACQPQQSPQRRLPRRAASGRAEPVRHRPRPRLARRRPRCGSRMHCAEVGWHHVASNGTSTKPVGAGAAPKEFSPTTMYRDDAISPELFHWESQNTTPPTRPSPAVPASPRARHARGALRPGHANATKSRRRRFFAWVRRRTSSTAVNVPSPPPGGCIGRCRPTLSPAHPS
jgi:hypothetical protein